MGPLICFTPNLVLKIENESNAQSVLDMYIRNADCFERFEPTRPENFYTLNYHRQMLIREYRAYTQGTFLRYHIYEREGNGQIIGAVNFNILHKGNKSFAEVGYKIDKVFQNRGYAYEAVTASIGIMSKHYNIHHFEARIHPDNIASIKLSQRLGFSNPVPEPQCANIMGRCVDLYRYHLDISNTQ